MYLTKLEAEILKLLSRKEMYGLELVNASSILKRGTVYVYLNRMTDKGFVKSHVQDTPPRRIYNITDLGWSRIRIHDAVLDAIAKEKKS